MRRPSVKVLGSFGAASLLGSVLAVSACSSDDSDGTPPAPQGGQPSGSGGSGGTPSATGGTTPTAGKTGGGAPGTGGSGTAGTGTGGTPPVAGAYDISIVIDNVKFIGDAAGGGGSPAGGAGGSPAAGAGGTLAGGAGGAGGNAGATKGGAGAGGKAASGGSGGKAAGGGGAGGSGGTVAGGAGGTAPGGSGGVPAGGGDAGSGGSGGSSSACPPIAVTNPLVTDFDTNWVPADTQGEESSFKGEGFTGGVFVYPSRAAMPPHAYPLAYSVSNGETTISGKVGDYSGFGLWLSCEINAAQFKGVEFDIKGNAGPSGTVKFLVQTSPNVYDAAKDQDSCTPANAAKSYEDCVNPSKVITVTATGAHVAITWAELTGGKPMAAVDPAQILGLQWDVIWPPGTPPAGTGGGGSGGAPAATGGAPAATGGTPAAGGGGASAGGGAGGKAGGGGGAGGSGGASGGGGSGGKT